jgi:hypothetical protein
MKALIDVIRSHPIRPGSIVHIDVKHDPWCQLLHRNGPCNCSPEVQVGGEVQ